MSLHPIVTFMVCLSISWEGRESKEGEEKEEGKGGQEVKEGEKQFRCSL